jgi:osmotically-inducible protein OsmY
MRRIVLATALLLACAGAAADPMLDADKELARRVMRALEKEDRMQAAAIDVTAKKGVVTLWGTAASQDERQRATRAAYRVIGVKKVENNLAITGAD